MEEKLVRVYEGLLNIADLVYTLKVALRNEEQPVSDTIAYSKVAGMIEKEIYSVAEEVESAGK